MGGAAPFEVRITSIETGREIARQSNFSTGCSIRIAVPSLIDGRYKVSVTDANGAGLEERNLIAQERLLAVPDELKLASLPELDRKIYYASWLSSIDGGQWIFEALQIVASLDCKQAAVSDWLSHWLGDQACNV